MNKIIYNINTSQLVNIIIPERLIQGQNDKVELWLDFGEFDYDWSVIAVFERQDGAKSNEILATLTDGLYKVILSSWFTDIEGTLKLTTKIKRPGEIIQPFGIALIPVDSGLGATDDTISDAQYQALLSQLNGLDVKIESHIQDKNNPHEVTAEQTGAYDKSNIDGKLNLINNLDITQNNELIRLENDKADITYVDSQDLILDGKIEDNIVDIGDLQSNKVDRTQKIIGIDLQNDISLEQFKIALGKATTTLDGLMSKEDKQHLDTLTDMLANGDSNIVDTIQEILDVFENYPQGADLAQLLAGKVDKVSGKGLSTNDFTNSDKNKLDGIEAGAEVNPYSKTQLDNMFDGKQDKLIAGYSITIDENNVISALGGDSYTNINYADLVTLRDSSNLKKGAFYRIIDYETTTVQEETRSAGHLFDIIVQALDEKTISENAEAVHSDRDVPIIKGITASIATGEGEAGDVLKRAFFGDNQGWTPEGFIYAWGTDADIDDGDPANLAYAQSDTPSAGDDVWCDGDYGTVVSRIEGDTYFANSKLEAWELKYCLDNDTDRFAWADDVNGKGVIYYMKDEYNNDLPYDFKNIQFKRDLFYDSDYDITFNDIYFYTFSAYQGYMAGGVQSDIEDATIITKQEAIDDGFNRCYNNVIKPFFTIDYSGTIDVATWELNNSIFVNKYASGDSYFECHSNTIGNGFSGNTIGNSFYSNTIGNDFIRNTIGNDFIRNTIGNGFYSNTIGNGFYSNTIGNEFYNNTIGNEFYNNTIGNRFSGNTIGNEFYNNTIENDFYGNTIGNEFYSNTIGNSVQYIQFSLDGAWNSQIRYLYLKNGLSGASSANRLDLYYANLYHREYPTTFERIANGNIVSSWEATPLTRAGKVKATKTTSTWSDI